MSVLRPITISAPTLTVSNPCHSLPAPLATNENLPALIMASREGDVAALTKLVADPNIRANINTIKDSKGQTALHHSLNGACVQILCRAGADVFIRDSLGNTPLHAATERHCSGAVRELLSFAESSTADAANARCVNAQNMMGETALHIAVKGQNKPICTLICSYKPDFSLVNHFGQTPLHLASKDDDLELVEMLVREGANPNAQDGLGMTALHVAVLGDCPDYKICRVLIENGADVDAVDSNGRKPIDLARMRKQEQKIHYLESQGGNIVPHYFARKEEGEEKFETKWVPPYARKTVNKKRRRFDLDLSTGDDRLVDRWGFEIPADLDETKRAELLHVKESELKVEVRRTGKWETMTASKETWEKWMKRNSAKIRERCCKGIPPAMRGRAWVLLSGADRTRAKYNQDYYKSLLCEQTSSLGQIDMDIHRTYRNHELFRTRYGTGQRMLFNILRAYSVYDKDVGYCQGMAEIAAILLMYMPEEDAFWVFVQIMAAPKYAVRELYLPGFAALHTHFHVHSRLLEQMVPKLHAHFEAIGMKTVFYATKWYSTLFDSVLPFEHTVRVWDIVMFEGTEFLYTIAVRTLEANQRRYLELDFADCMPLLLNLKDVVTEPANEYISTATHHPVLHAFIDSCRLEYAKQQFQINHDDSAIPNPDPVRPGSVTGVAAQHTSSEDYALRLMGLSKSQPDQARSQPQLHPRWQGASTPKNEHTDTNSFIVLSFKRRKNSIISQRASESSGTPVNTPVSTPYRNPSPPVVHSEASFATTNSSLVSFTPAARSKPIPVPACSPVYHAPPRRPPRTAPQFSAPSAPVFHQLPPSGIPVEVEFLLDNKAQDNSQHT